MSAYRFLSVMKQPQNRLWPDGPFYRAAGFPISTDSILLSAFARVQGAPRCVDLGCGAGLLLVLLGSRCPAAGLTGVELQADCAEAARQNLAANGHRAEIITGDLRQHRALLPAGRYDLVVANPPYYPVGSGAAAADPVRATARSEAGCTLQQLCAAAAWLCRTGGAFCLVHKPERLSELCVCLTQSGLEPKRLRFVCSRAGAAPSLLLLESRRGARPGLVIQPPLVLLRDDGTETDELRAIYHR